MIRKWLFISCLSVVLISASIFSYWRLSDYIAWEPTDHTPFVMADSFTKPVRHPARRFSEAVSQHVLQARLAPVTAAVMMHSVMRAYNQLDAEYGEFVAFFGTSEIIEVWGEGLGERFGLDEPITAARVIGAEKGARELIDQLVTQAIELRDFERIPPNKPPRDDIWRPFEGNIDFDMAAGSLPLSQPLDIPMPPPPPEKGSIADRLDNLAVKLSTDLIDNEQRRISIYWQGSMDFNKNNLIGGFAPSDVWQMIAFSLAGQTMDERTYTELSAGLAAVLRDAIILTWRVKYEHWTERPSVRQRGLFQSINNPPFPGYVSGHAVTAAAAGHYLAAKDPANAETYLKLADDASKSRIFGSVHVPSDNYFGEKLGQLVAHAHLGIDGNVSYARPVPASVDYALMSVFAWGYELKRDVERFIRGVNTDGQPTFEKVRHNIDASLPVPIVKGVVEDARIRTNYGSIAIRDIDVDSDGDVLVSGHNTLSLYQNTGDFNYRLLDTVSFDGVFGSYFSHGESGVDGIWAFGIAGVRWYPLDPQNISLGEPQSFPSDNPNSWGSGMILHDYDDDGDEDALLLQAAGQQKIQAHDSSLLSYGNYLFIREEDGKFRRSDEIRSAGFSVSGGLLDIDQDGTVEEFIINYESPIEVRTIGLERQWDVSHLRTFDIGGVSFTPVKLQEMVALHVTRPYRGPDWPYPKNDPVDSELTDHLLVWDEEQGKLIDIANGRLNEGQQEWGLGSVSGDINGDGLQDLVIVQGREVVQPFPCGIRVLVQRPGNDFEPVTKATGIDLEGFCPRSVILDDADGDHDLDIMMSNGRELQIWRNTTDIPIEQPSLPWAGKPQGYLAQPNY